jgi:hypothetical protein
MLHHENGDLSFSIERANKRNGFLNFPRIEPCENLIQEKEFGMGGQGSGYFEPLALREAQGMGKVMGERRETGTFEDLFYLPVNLCGSRSARLSKYRGGFDVFKGSHFKERADDLERPGYPEMTQFVRPHSSNRGFHESYFSMRRREKTAEESKEGCLASAVGSDHTDDLTWHDTKGYLSKGSQSPEVPGEVLCFKKW